MNTRPKPGSASRRARSSTGTGFELGSNAIALVFFLFEHVADHPSPFGLQRLVQALGLGKRSALRLLRELGAAPRGGVDRRCDERVENTLSVEHVEARPAVVPLGLATRFATDSMLSPEATAIHAVPNTVSSAIVAAISSLSPRFTPALASAAMKRAT